MVSENSKSIDGLLDEYEHQAQAYWDFMTPQKRAEHAWLAGLIDGEGSIDIIKRYSKRSLQPSYVARLQLGMTDKDTIIRAREIAETGRIYVRRQHADRNKFPNQKTYYVWVATTQQTATVLQRCLPFLYTKRKRAEIALTLIQDINLHRPRPSPARIEYREKLRQFMHILNT